MKFRYISLFVLNWKRLFKNEAVLLEVFFKIGQDGGEKFRLTKIEKRPLLYLILASLDLHTIIVAHATSTIHDMGGVRP